MMKVVQEFGALVCGIVLLLPLALGHPSPACKLPKDADGEDRPYAVDEVMEFNCPGHKDKKYKVVCTSHLTWLSMSECYEKKPKKKPAAKPHTPDPPSKHPEPSHRPDHPPSKHPEPGHTPYHPPRRHPEPDHNMPYRPPRRHPEPDHNMPYRPPRRHPEPDHNMPYRPPRRHPEPDHGPYQPPPQNQKPPKPSHMPYHPPPTMKKPVYVTKPPTTSSTPHHIVPPANQVKPINQVNAKPCSYYTVLQYLPPFPYGPYPFDSVRSGDVITLECYQTAVPFPFYAFCYDGTFYWTPGTC